MDDAQSRDAPDVGAAKIRLRGELNSSLQTNQGQPFILLRDNLRSQFFRFGLDEWRVAQSFDGETTLREVARREDGSTPASEVLQLASWLVQAGLAEVVEGALTTDATTSKDDASRGETLCRQLLPNATSLARWNPLFISIPFPNPEPLLRRVFPWLAWTLSLPCFAVWLFVCTLGGLAVCGDFDRFRSSLGQVLAVDNWLYLLITWIVLKVLHELGHALACMRYGGSVSRCGVLLILFSPIAYVDVTSAWSFRSKWRRIFVSAAGIYVELFFAGLAALVWAGTDSPWLSTIGRNVVITASASTLLFNGNFLMRFDGYYILADLLEVQNLYSAGSQYIRYLGRRYALNLRAALPRVSADRLWIVKLYGVAALLWRLVFYVGIIVIAAHLFRGAGIALAIFSAVLWFVVPAIQFVLFVWRGRGNEQPDRRRLAWVSIGGVLGAAMLLALPWPGATQAPGFVEFAPLRTVRADSPGFVRDVDVHAGQAVRAGQVLLTLDNPELVRELADLELQLRKQEIERRVWHRDGEMAKYVAARQQRESLEKQLEQLRTKVASLTVRAPLGGHVIGSGLDSLVGRYVRMGAELLSVGSAVDKEVRVSIPQDDVEFFRQWHGRPVQVRIHGRPGSLPDARLEKVHPRASRRVIHASLAATFGGPLSVQQDTDDTAEGQAEVQLVEPHFEGVVALPAETAQGLYAGQRCQVSVGRGRQSVAAKLWQLIAGFVERKSGRS